LGVDRSWNREKSAKALFDLGLGLDLGFDLDLEQWSNFDRQKAVENFGELKLTPD
jgi:hypothetical protein